MKKSRCILKIITLTIMLLTIILTTTSEASFWSDVFSKGDEFLDKGKQDDLYINTSDGNKIPVPDVSDQDIRGIIEDIYNIIFPLGVATTVIIGAVLGIKFMLASAEDKAKVKESMVPYVIGCIVIFGAFGIWRLCIEIFSALN